ncbi:hypothetical protein, partial [Streptomyces sp. C1-2]|uniref:hypothetical protein n=1 Tax=Streptomyces sp. C1-2 TaxID=2720022 RepID=UPI0019CFFFB3
AQKLRRELRQRLRELIVESVIGHWCSPQDVGRGRGAPNNSMSKQSPKHAQVVPPAASGTPSG